MTDIETLNSFLQRTDLSEQEKVIKNLLLETDAELKANAKEREELSNSLRTKDTDFLKLSGAFDAQLKLILTLSKLNKPSSV